MQVVVAFRGTEQVKWKDLVTDLNFGSANLNYENAEEEMNLLDKILRNSDAPTVRDLGIGAVHESCTTAGHVVIKLVNLFGVVLQYTSVLLFSKLKKVFSDTCMQIFF